MFFCVDTYEGLKNRFSIFAVTGNADHGISDVKSEYLNSAQRLLHGRHDWPWLMSRRQYTLSNKTITLADNSADREKIKQVFTDDSGDGRPKKFYFQRSSHSDDGYYVTSTFSKSTGITRTLTFYYAPSSNPWVLSKTLLSDMTANADISFFPKELVVAQAELLRMRDVGLIQTAEYQTMLSSFEDILAEAKNEMSNENTTNRIEVKDINGRNVQTESYDMVRGPGHNVVHGEANDRWL